MKLISDLQKKKKRTCWNPNVVRYWWVQLAHSYILLFDFIFIWTSQNSTKICFEFSVKHETESWRIWWYINRIRYKWSILVKLWEGYKRLKLHLRDRKLIWKRWIRWFFHWTGVWDSLRLLGFIEIYFLEGLGFGLVNHKEFVVWNGILVHAHLH